MVSVYKDPKGKGIFTAHEDAVQVTVCVADGPAVANTEKGDLQDENDALKSKVQHLELMVVEYQV